MTLDEMTIDAYRPVVSFFNINYVINKVYVKNIDKQKKQKKSSTATDEAFFLQNIIINFYDVHCSHFVCDLIPSFIKKITD